MTTSNEAIQERVEALEGGYYELTGVSKANKWGITVHQVREAPVKSLYNRVRSDRSLYNLVRSDRPGIISSVELSPAEAWDEAAETARDLGWLHDPAHEDLIARNPHKETP